MRVKSNMTTETTFLDYIGWKFEKHTRRIGKLDIKEVEDSTLISTYTRGAFDAGIIRLYLP